MAHPIVANGVYRSTQPMEFDFSGHLKPVFSFGRLKSKAGYANMENYTREALLTTKHHMGTPIRW